MFYLLQEGYIATLKFARKVYLETNQPCKHTGYSYILNSLPKVGSVFQMDMSDYKFPAHKLTSIVSTPIGKAGCKHILVWGSIEESDKYPIV